MAQEKQLQKPAPAAIPALTLRKFAGDEDYRIIQSIFLVAKAQDGIFWDWGNRIEDFIDNYQYYPNFRIEEQFAIAALEDDPIATLEYFWQENEETRRRDFYWNLSWLPEVSDTNIPDILLRFIEKECRRIDARLAEGYTSYLNARCMGTAERRLKLLQEHDFQRVTTYTSMVRDLSAPIEGHPLPTGIEIRPVQPEHYHAIWVANHLAFEDHWGDVESEEDFQRWMQHAQFQPNLWQVAWDGDRICGMVLNYIDQDDTVSEQGTRGQIEGVSVQAAWRKRGIAKALISESLRLFREMGLKEAVLGVNTHNRDGALRLYRGLGFVEMPDRTSSVFEKRLES